MSPIRPAVVPFVPVQRRTVVRTAVWSVPVVAATTAAPAFAASCNQAYAGVLDFAANYVRSSTTGGVATVPITGSGSITVTFSSAFSSYSPNAVNMSVSTTQVGGTGSAGLTLWQSVNGGTGANANLNDPTKNQTLTISFSRPVSGLSFTMTDVDSTNGDFWDAVAVNSPVAFTATKPANIVGSGTTAAPFRQNSVNSPADNATGTNGNVTLTFAQALTTLQISYWNRETVLTTDPDQAMFLSKMSFTVLNAGC